MLIERFTAQGRGARRRVAVLTAIGALLVVLVPPVSPTSALQAVTSSATWGDFESSTSATPAGWTVSAATPNRAYVSTGTAFTGIRAMHLVDSSSTASATALRKGFGVVAGAEYHVQAYTFTWSGTQNLGLRFYDVLGRQLGRTVTPTTGAVSVWSRVEVRAVAPAGATSAAIEVSSYSTNISKVTWDTMSLIRPDVTNSSFETVGLIGTIPGWTVSAGSGTSAYLSTGATRSGRRSVRLVDGSTTGLVRTTSAASPVFPGVTHDLRAWIRPSGGSHTVTVRWLRADRTVSATKRIDVSKARDTWSLVATQLVAPTNAHWATIELSSGAAATGSAYWDVLDLRPTRGAPIRTFAPTAAVQPVDSFTNTMVVEATTIAGRAKVFTVVNGSPAEFQLADVETGTVETRLPLGTSTVGWALTTTPDGSIYLGGNDGHLQRWRPGDTTLTDLGRVTPTTTFVWDVETAPDGRIWGVSYPASELWVLDPATDRITNVGRLSSRHEYARSLAVDSRYAWVGLGSTDPTIMRVSLADPSQRVVVPLPTSVTSGNIVELDSLGRYLQVRLPAGTTAMGLSMSSERRLYDTVTGSWDVTANYSAQKPSSLGSWGSFYYFRYNRLWAVSGSTGAMTEVGPVSSSPGRDRLALRTTIGGRTSNYVLAYDTLGELATIDLADRSEATYPINFVPTKMRIKSIGTGAGSTLWVGGYGGSSLSVLDAGTLTGEQYPKVPFGTGVIGEVEGTITHGTTQYLGTYTDAQIFRYDTTQPWVDGTNPRLVTALGPTHQQDRPLAWATAGARTFFGTIPRYGLLGGALGIFSSDTSAPTVVAAPVKDQSIVSLAASGSVVYGGTSRWGGLGATPTQPSAKVFAFDAATGRKLWEVAPVAGADAFGAVAFGPNGSLWAAYGPALVELDPRTGATIRHVVLYPPPDANKPVLRNADLEWADGVFYVAAMSRVYTFDPATLRVSNPVTSGVSTPQIAVLPGQLLVPMDTVLRSYTPK